MHTNDQATIQDEFHVTYKTCQKHFNDTFLAIKLTGTTSFSAGGGDMLANI